MRQIQFVQKVDLIKSVFDFNTNDVHVVLFFSSVLGFICQISQNIIDIGHCNRMKLLEHNIIWQPNHNVQCL